MTELRITVGIPGCGKSTWCEQQDGFLTLSSDALRIELLGDVARQDANREIFAQLENRAVIALNKGESVIIDATNLQPKNRKGWMQKAELMEVPAYAYRFEVSEDYAECQARNLARERQVPEDVMKRFHNLFNLNCSVETLEREGWVVSEVQP